MLENVIANYRLQGAEDMMRWVRSESYEWQYSCYYCSYSQHLRIEDIYGGTQ